MQRDLHECFVRLPCVQQMVDCRDGTIGVDVPARCRSVQLPLAFLLSGVQPVAQEAAEEPVIAIPVIRLGVGLPCSDVRAFHP
ncbi:hypothetical protein RI103_33360 [Paraburkholderia sp. FT54]|uniref:hypothetical protein n=1 Tax=Paraburkholderia sp. FT54 TaxID=3074437 RepID=UPI00287814FC|nr:hypothetical protein [Paraburkholderia sp. FT54]WNC94824.1 hypothetical protein RI103_33360 [Paraburkholderia sp. FT54]